MRPYNVPNDRALAPSTGGVEYNYKHEQVGGCWMVDLTGTGRWHRSKEQSAQSAAGALRGRTRWSALTAFCVAAALLSLNHAVTTYSGFRIDVEHRLTPCRHVR